jgi:hypothetical protein
MSRTPGGTYWRSDGTVNLSSDPTKAGSLPWVSFPSNRAGKGTQ